MKEIINGLLDFTFCNTILSIYSYRRLARLLPSHLTATSRSCVHVVPSEILLCVQSKICVSVPRQERSARSTGPSPGPYNVVVDIGETPVLYCAYNTDCRTLTIEVVNSSYLNIFLNNTVMHTLS